MKIIVAADHRGFALKSALKEYLTTKGHDVEDVGAHVFDAEDDYPDFGYPAAHRVADIPGAKGILICGSGMGMDVVANKVKGIRATIAYSPESAAHGAGYDGVNVITLAADMLTPEDAASIVEKFLTTPLMHEEKYARRIKKIAMIEEQNFR